MARAVSGRGPDGLQPCTRSCACRALAATVVAARADGRLAQAGAPRDERGQRGAAAQDGGRRSQVLPWRDVLHEGPVPAGLDEDRLRVARAAFLAGLGWAAEDRVLADMSARDALPRRRRSRPGRSSSCGSSPTSTTCCSSRRSSTALAGRDARARLAIAGEREFVGVARARRRRAAGGARRRGDGGPDPRADGRPRRSPTAGAAVWAAFRAPEPDALQPLAGAGGTPRAARARRGRRAATSQQFPWRGSGLNRTERILLEAVADGAATPVEAFVAQQRAEERPFMGDATVFTYLRRLADGPRARCSTAGPPLALTALGRAVLAGTREWEERPGALARRRAPPGGPGPLALRPGRRAGSSRRRRASGPSARARRPSASGSLRLPHFGRLHAGRAALLARALADQPVGVVDERVEGEEAAAGDPDPARVPVVDEDRRDAGLRVVVRRQPADVPAVAHRQQREHRDLRVLGGVQRAEQLVERQLGRRRRPAAARTTAPGWRTRSRACRARPGRAPRGR